MIKVLIADDQELIRQSLEIVLSTKEGIEVTGTAKDGREVIRCIRKEKPDVILMDVRMPEMDGVQCTEIIKENYPQIKIIILTTFDDDEFVFSALKHGASGYLLKGISMDDLEEAIKTVVQGGSMINPDVATKVVELFSKMAQSNFDMMIDAKNVEDLNETERKVTHLVGCGMSNKEISGKLSLSEGTIRNYLSSILNKLDLRDRTQLAIWEVQNGIGRKFQREDRILINGIIDLYFKDGDDYVLVDYKTDNVESMEELVERYEVQLKFYKKALEMNYNIEISELVIYSLKLNSQIIL